MEEKCWKEAQGINKRKERKEQINKPLQTRDSMVKEKNALTKQVVRMIKNRYNELREMKTKSKKEKRGNK
jgi:hypothetical protein